jgi:hypothetical protein
MQFTQVAAVVAIAVSLGGCGGGGGSVVPTSPSPTPQATGSPLSFQGTAPIIVSTSPDTLSPTGAKPITWSVYPNSGACVIELDYAGHAVVSPSIVYAGMPVLDSYASGGGGGAYTLRITAAPGSTCSIPKGGGTLTWPT